MEPLSSAHLDKEHEPPVISNVSMDIVGHHHESQDTDDGDKMNIDEIVENEQRSNVSVTVNNMKEAPLSVAANPASMLVKNDSISDNSKHVLLKAKKDGANGQGPAKDKIGSKILLDSSKAPNPTNSNVRLCLLLRGPNLPLLSLLFMMQNSVRNDLSLLHPNAAKVNKLCTTSKGLSNCSPDSAFPNQVCRAQHEPRHNQRPNRRRSPL